MLKFSVLQPTSPQSVSFQIESLTNTSASLDSFHSELVGTLSHVVLEKRPLSESVYGMTPIICSCRCHERHAFSTPRWLAFQLGSTHVSYQTRTRCDKACCGRYSTTVGSLLYVFPWWSTRKSVYLSYTYNGLTGAAWSLSVTRVLESSSPILHYNYLGDNQALESCLRSGEGSPMDLGERGDTLLHVSIQARDSERKYDAPN
jgi:hypothetical protein